MDTPLGAVILSAERLHDGLVIKFSDGKCAFYSTVLLYVMVSEADELDETAVVW